MARLCAALAKKEVARNHKNNGTLTREAEFSMLARSQLAGLTLCALVIYQVVVWIMTTIQTGDPSQVVNPEIWAASVPLFRFKNALTHILSACPAGLI